MRSCNHLCQQATHVSEPLSRSHRPTPCPGPAIRACIAKGSRAVGACTSNIRFPVVAAGIGHHDRSTPTPLRGPDPPSPLSRPVIDSKSLAYLHQFSATLLPATLTTEYRLSLAALRLPLRDRNIRRSPTRIDIPIPVQRSVLTTAQAQRHKLKS